MEENKPILYYFYTSYYSQKVLMLLKESGLDYDGRIVNMQGQETQSSWFLEMNPKGEVPVLKVGEKIVNGSDNIMNYLEEEKLGTKSLFPKDSSSAKKHQYWVSKLETLPIAPLSYGIAYNPHLRKVQKGPIKGILLSKMRNFMDNRSSNLRKKAAENSGTLAESVLLTKAAKHDQEYHLFSSEVEYKRMLKELTDMLDEIEVELISQSDKKWLFGDMFTAADCILAVSLNRLHWIGHEDYVINEKRPQITRYWNDLQSRESFVESTTFPSLTLYMLKDTIRKNKELIFGYTLLPIVAGMVYFGLKTVFPQ